MPFTMKEIGYGFLVPAVVAAVVLYALEKTSRGNRAANVPAAIAFASGFCAGYFLSELGPWQPASHWQWLPYVVLLAAVTGPATATVGNPWLRVVLCVVPGVTAAWVLVPDWPDLEPSRTVYLVSFSVLAVLLSGAMQPLASRVPDRLFTTAVCVTFAAAAVLLVLADSLRFAQMAGVAAGAMAGCVGSSLFGRSSGRFAGLSHSYAFVVAGLMLVGRVNSFSDVPLASYLLIPATPLMLWLSLMGPLSRLSGTRRMRVTAMLLMVPLAVAFSLVVVFANPN